MQTDTDMVNNLKIEILNFKININFKAQNNCPMISYWFNQIGDFNIGI